MKLPSLPATCRPLLLAVALAGSVSVLSGCGEAGASADKPDAAAVIAIPVEVAPLNHGSISIDYHSTATLEAKEEAFVVARASGIIQHIFVEEGDYVEKGQPLAQLEPERYELALQKARADLSGIKQELDKIDKVYHKKLVSDDTFDKLKAQYEAAKANLALAELDLKETTIIAPISGFIAERNAKVGNLTESFQRERMFHIVDQKQLLGVVYLPEKELANISKQQQALLSIASMPGAKVNAWVERISPVVDANTGTFKVTLSVPNQDNVLKSGMFAQVFIQYGAHDDAVLLPQRAMLSVDNQNTVFVVDDKGVANKVPVTIGYQSNGQVEILSGLKGDEKVVITGHQNLKDQSPVQVVNG